jgi:predicted RNase H-like HicB family nuclease
MTASVTAPSEKLISEKSTKLTYEVMLEEQEKGGYRATVLGWPECQAFGSTREEALTNLRHIITERLDKVEIVSIEIDRPKPEHPWMKFAGMCKDDPYFDEMQADIADLRRERDEQMEAYYRQMDAEEETK